MQKELKQLYSPGVRPVQILDNQHGRSKGPEQLQQRPEQAMAPRYRVTKRLWRGWKPVRQLGKESAQRPHNGTRRREGRVGGYSRQRLNQRSQRERLAQAMTLAGQHSASVKRWIAKHLRQKARLADSRFPFYYRHRRGRSRRSN